MKKIFPAFFLFLTLTSSSAPAAADSKNESLLAVNRSLLAAWEEEYVRLDAKTDKSESDHRRALNLQTKIRALKDDAERLKARLSQSDKADAFLGEVLKRKADWAAAPAEKRPRTREDLNRLHDRALFLASEKDLSGAAQIYEEILLDNPNDDEAYILLGHCRLLLGDFKKAEEAFEGAVDIDPANIREITPFYENLALLNPGDPNAQTNLGYAQLMVGDPVQAKAAFKDALALDPENEPALRGLSMVESQS